MFYAQFYDQVLAELLSGSFSQGINLLVGMLDAVGKNSANQKLAFEKLHAHDLYFFLAQDPLIASANCSSPQYLSAIDFICEPYLDPCVSSTGRRLFEVTSQLTFCRAVRDRRAITAAKIKSAWQLGQSVCIFGTSQLRAIGPLAGQNLSNVTLICQDEASSADLSARFGQSPTILQIDPGRVWYFPTEIGIGFDFICAGDLPDRTETDALADVLLMLRDRLTPTGKIVVTSFVPEHLGAGWRSACLQWPITCYREADFINLGTCVDLNTRTYRDATNSVVWCELSKNTDARTSLGVLNHGL
jgi:hypothetical protein